jgi:tetratricopeptide (TPR) repeat protein
MSLSDEEIRQKISEADKNPNNLDFQKSLGTALYRYASMKKDTKNLAESARILTRVYEKNPSDKDTAIMLGHAHFDIGFYQKDNENLAKARMIYQKILETSPKDADIRTDLGLTYYLQNPPDYEKAVAEMKKSLENSPKHEKSLQFLVQIFIKQQKTQEAETYLAKLREINPNTPSLSEIQTQLAQSDRSNQ